RQLFRHLRLELIEAPFFKDELHPGLALRLPVAVGVENLQDRLAGRQHLADRKEIGVKLGELGARSESPADEQLEAVFGLSPDLPAGCDEAEVMNGRQAALRLASGERNFKLTGKVLIDRISQ